MQRTLKCSSQFCSRCERLFTEADEIVASKGEYFHGQCFVCAQCFRRLLPTTFYEHEGRRYCKYDFQKLFATKCCKCDNYIMDTVVRALGRRWHADCLRCENCNTQLVNTKMQTVNSRPYCHACWTMCKQEEELRWEKCAQCQSRVEPTEMLKLKGSVYHAYHFKCTLCFVELTGNAQERSGQPYCLNCYQKRLGIPICAACRRLVEDQVIWAVGKAWHRDHFVCHYCELAFMGSEFYEWRGKAYCLQHYQCVSGNICHVCRGTSDEIVVTFGNKCYCPGHFRCTLCDKLLTEKSKVYEIDLKPTCKTCYDYLPREYRIQLAKHHVEKPMPWKCKLVERQKASSAQLNN